MNQRMWLACFAVSLCGCLPSNEPNMIVVDGVAKIEVVPDTFSLVAKVRGRADTQGDALAEVTSRLTAINETLPLLEGLTGIKIETAEATIIPVLNAECVEDAPYDQEDACPVEQYFASVDLEVVAMPAERAGQALALLSESGAESVSINEFSLSNYEEMRAQTVARAVEDATGKARNIAAAAGTTLAGPLKIQYGGGFSEAGDSFRGQSDRFADDEIIVTASRVQPNDNLELAPPNIEIEAKVVAAFRVGD